MSRSVWFGFVLTLALAGTVHAQAAAGRVTITPLAGYSLGYTREVAIEFAGATDRTSWEVGGEAVAGLNAELALGGRFGAAVGVLRRGKVDPRMDCQTGDGARICVPQSPEEGALWIVRAGATWMPSARLPLYVAGGPLFAYQEGLGGIDGQHHWGLGLSVGARLPLGSSRFALDAGLDEHTIFWRSTENVPEADMSASHLWVARVGLAVRL